MTRRGLDRTGSRFGKFRLLGLTATLGVVAVTLSGCSWSTVLGLGWPEGITPEAQINRHLWVGSLIAALVVGAIVFALIFWSSAFHRHKKTDTELPRQFGYNMPLEIVLTIVPFLIIAVLFYFTVVVQERMLHKESDPEVVVDITAFQWNWKFGYQEIAFKDGTFEWDGRDLERKEAMASRTDNAGEEGGEEGEGEDQAQFGAFRATINPEDRSYLNYSKVETLGTSYEIPILVLPAGKRIEFHLASADVLHSFWVPEFLFKRDVFPNPAENNSDNVFQVSEIDRTGAFVGRCAELCGTYHSMMNFEVRVVSPNDFAAYMRQRIDGRTTAQALRAINQPPTAVTTESFDTRRGNQSLAQK